MDLWTFFTKVKVDGLEKLSTQTLTNPRLKLNFKSNSTHQLTKTNRRRRIRLDWVGFYWVGEFDAHPYNKFMSYCINFPFNYEKHYVHNIFTANSKLLLIATSG